MLATKVEFLFRLFIGNSFMRRKPLEVTNTNIHQNRMHFHPFIYTSPTSFGASSLLRPKLFLIFIYLSPKTVNVRSISALDAAAVQRARARQQYSTMARMKVTAGTASLRKLTNRDSILSAFHESNELTFVRLQILLLLFVLFVVCACILLNFSVQKDKRPNKVVISINNE